MQPLSSGLTQADFIKVYYNVGGNMDIPNGEFLPGTKGQQILNGGHGPFTLIVGAGNSYKTTLLNFFNLSTLSKLILGIIAHNNNKASVPFKFYPTVEIYDTEVTYSEEHIKDHSQLFEIFKELDIMSNGMWVVTDKTKYYANVWHEKQKVFCADKLKNKNIMVDLPFIGRDGKNMLNMPLTTLMGCDSFSHFETQDAANMKDKFEIGDAGLNMLHQRQGLSKTAFLSDVPRLTGGAKHYLTATAHVGSENGIIAGPPGSQPPKKLQHLPAGLKIKGATEQATFLASSCWFVKSAKPLVDGDRQPEFPRDEHDDRKGETDLNLMLLQMLRSKNGSSGYIIPVIVSQQEGVLPELSNFYLIKEYEFGYTRSGAYYTLDLLPDVKFTRVTIRNKLKENQKLRTAMKITAELLQLWQYKRAKYASVLCDIKTLKNDLEALGYNWDEILGWRFWYTIFDYDMDVPSCSILDLLRIRMGLYKPWWKQETEKVAV